MSAAAACLQNVFVRRFFFTGLFVPFSVLAGGRPTGFLIPLVGLLWWIVLFGFHKGMSEERGYIIVAQQSRGLETGPAHTINLPYNVDSQYEGNLVAFANSFGFFDTGDVDANGRNIFLLIMGAMKYCSPAACIATTMFQYAVALRQQTTHGTPHHVTPLKLLCQDSDKHLLAHDVVKSILDHNILDVAAFAVPDGPKASVFFFYFVWAGGRWAGMQLNLHYVWCLKQRPPLGQTGSGGGDARGSAGVWVGACVSGCLQGGGGGRGGGMHSCAQLCTVPCTIVHTCAHLLK